MLHKSFTLLLLLLAQISLSNERPNILFIMVDDLGSRDLSAYGSKDIQTPQIDQLMDRGMRFTQFTANSCVCSPSRAAFLTGRNQDMVGVPGVVRTHDHNSWGYLDPEAVTIADVFKSNNYRTSLIGKWHLGLQSPNHPNERGFEIFHGFLGDMMDDYWEHTRHGVAYMYHNSTAVETKGTHATELFTNWAIEEIKQAQKDPRPFFQFLSYNAPHDPIHPPKKYYEYFKKKQPNTSEKRAKIGGLIEHLDYSIGRVLDTLNELEIDKNTLVIFTSDNGGKIKYGADNGELRADKTHMYEGGLRVCTSFTWPEKIRSKSLSDFRAMTMDFMPTLLDAVNIDYSGHMDGKSFLPELLFGQQENFTKRKQFYTWLQIYKKHALRIDDWKLVNNSKKSQYELFNLKNDPFEKKDLSEKHPEKFSDMRKAMDAYLSKANQINWKRPSQKKSQ
ncbi:N-acetylgalactosamine 6-sulfatase (GALNS) [Lentisphaera araneosa HTCC2155]|uniref:N-acetylgalactosamine 6-sulfatase (GALNS) n=1 Tax=Lentisphaera araneosa HTCC2155 TaxID=313628 RepID=A6DGX5_9BACT|nr:sulfatase-like hydrolase/transferase [Lentisphaera araneosa]EDM28858.1 N-acetylgalactosamine 6-sulfatase (GALNS) [Lentisphaera araneosa HTCC2155]